VSEKTILEQIGEWFHNFWYGQPEQTQHEGTSSADESGATTEVASAGGTVETVVDVEEKPQGPLPAGDSRDTTLPRYKGTVEVS